MLRQERRMFRVSLSMCSRVKYLRKPSPLSNYLMNCSLADSEPLYISQGSPSASYPPFNFQHPQMCSMVEILQDRHGTFATTGRSVRNRRGTTCKLRGATLLQDFCAARTDFAGNSQLLKLLLSVLCRLLQGEEDSACS